MKAIVAAALLAAAASAAAAQTEHVVFVVRAGNPRMIRDWNDLSRAGRKVIMADPKTSDEGKWNYLGAFAYALKQPGGTTAKALTFVAALLRNVPMVEPDAAKAAARFLGGTGDVLIATDADARAIVERSNHGAEIVVPSVTAIDVDGMFGGWDTAVRTHFAAGGTFDQVYEPGLAQ